MPTELALSIGAFIVYMFIGIGVVLEVVMPILFEDKKISQLTKVATLILIVFLPLVILTNILFSAIIAVERIIQKIKLFKEEG